MPSSSVARTPKALSLLIIIVLTIIAVVPFQGFLTTWAGSNAGGLLMWRAWKEFLLLPAIGISIWYFIKDARLRTYLLGSHLVQLVLMYSVWLSVVSLISSRGTESLVLGLVIQLRLFIMLLLGMVITFYNPISKTTLRKVIFYPAVIVVVFGLLQLFVLPMNFLSHFGYSKDTTIPPFFTIDAQLSKIRIASTLRGPNPLGVYLIIPLLLSAASVWARTRKAWLHVLFLVSGLIVLYGSQSRGAWLAFIAACITWLACGLSKKKLLTFGLIAVVLAGGVGTSVYQYRHTSFVQDVVLHDNPSKGGPINSDQGHVAALKDGLHDIAMRPWFGCGVGCAGPASTHSPEGTKISENYFIQTAQEAGVIGLILLLIIFSFVALRLYKASEDPFIRVLLASFIGICVASLLAHAWADDTVAYIWWGVAFLAIMPNLDKTSKQPSTHRFDLP